MGLMAALKKKPPFFGCSLYPKFRYPKVLAKCLELLPLKLLLDNTGVIPAPVSK